MTSLPDGSALPRRSSVLAVGATAGVLGGLVVAVWLFIVDLIRGQPFRVPDLLGHILFHAVGGGATEGAVAHVVVYTIFHFAIFIAIGVAASAILRRSEHQPAILAGAFLLFVVFEAGFFTLSLLMTESRRLGMPAWYVVSIGNVLAAATMGWFLWRRHPGIRARTDAVLGGRHGS